ncbi:hypothetical protein LTR62_004422 [Meristemomyces frigidus]|uniref:Transmembrane protein n=1 Tax=Meristemomyces frigidus TaxID=1508187 RepID=A0AAN7YG58_9PEZI|nr:hypothetical protein LTR62_004422 [Meristemomyces frigidus]
MPAAAVIKGLIVTISIITALSVAVLENPQVQAWLEEQRQRIADLLRTIGEDLDPESRRQAEAFAYEGRTLAADDGLRREASGSREAAAVATGTALAASSVAVRRIPVRGPSEDEAEERRRKGREYLARRNQQMMEMQERRKAGSSPAILATPPSPTSFDQMVNENGDLRNVETASEAATPLELLSPRPMPSVPRSLLVRPEEVEPETEQPVLADTNTASEAFRFGSLFANPFSDEFALDRSETPRPIVPPKVPIAPDVETIDAPCMPGSFRASAPGGDNDQDELTYEEQLAIALSLSEAENANTATVRQRQSTAGDDDIEMKTAIEASLRDMDSQQAAYAVANDAPLTPRARPVESHTLVDLTPPSPRIASTQPEVQRGWNALFGAVTQDMLSADDPALSEISDELYRITPELTHARLASFDAQQRQTAPTLTVSNTPYDPVREAANSHTLSPEPRPMMEASFYSAPSSILYAPSSSNTLEREPEVIEAAGASTPHANTVVSDSDSEIFASLSRSASQIISHPASEVSNVEVVDLEDDSDMDVLSEEGQGVSTPDSWTEVGSRDGESETGGHEQRQHVQPSL